MRKLIPLLILILLASCSEKKEKKEYIIVSIPDKQEQTKSSDEIVKSSPESLNGDFIWNNKSYAFIINKTVDENASIIKTHNGQKFYNNKITLEIRRDDGSVFVNHVFNKSSFAANLNESLKSHGILESISFSQVNGNSLLFEGTINDPENDEVAPFDIYINSTGGISIKESESLDTESPFEEED